MLSDAAKQEIRQLMKRYPQPRSALLPALYVAQREVGWLPEEVIAEVASIFGLEPAEVRALVGFYGMLHDKPVGEYEIAMCTGVPCMLRGADRAVAHLKRRLRIDWGETTKDGRITLKRAECLGSCGTAPMLMVTERATGRIRYFEELNTNERVDQVVELLRKGNPFETTERWPNRGPAHHGGMEPRYLLANVDKSNSHTIDVYLEGGGYQAAEKALKQMTPQQVVEEVKAAGVRGRGGAGFPAGVKWGFLPKGVYPRYLVCNADEGEPGTFKDRMLMEYDPHQVIEGILISSYACEVERAFIYIRGEYGFAYERLKTAIKEAYERGYLGKNILSTDYSLELTLHRGAGAYICGEETALLTSLEGYRGHPRLKPPFPAAEGLYRKPTIINNVETLCNIPHVIKHGAHWYRQFGTERSPGFRIFSLSGEVKHPGLYELPHGTTLRELIYEYGGGTIDDRPIKAIIPGGLSMPQLPASALDTPLDFESVQKAGSLLGSASVIVICEGTSVIQVAQRTMSFYRHESCGKCTPCREGTGWLEKILLRIEDGQGRIEDLDEILRLSEPIERQTFCPFGPAAVWGVESSIHLFRDEYIEHIRRTNPDGKAPEVPIRTVYRPPDFKMNGGAGSEERTTSHQQPVTSNE
ncbi:MAG TPA: NADH oxidoreductase (quinone) subunit F [Anaerolineae bacterium]|nr:NADH oxidoreductase (quinone) subunit F [Anaerolineae bacterium]